MNQGEKRRRGGMGEEGRGERRNIDLKKRKG